MSLLGSYTAATSLWVHGDIPPRAWLQPMKDNKSQGCFPVPFTFHSTRRQSIWAALFFINGPSSPQLEDAACGIENFAAGINCRY